MSDETEPKAANVVELQPKQRRFPLHSRSTSSKPRRPFCEHKQALVDACARTLECAACGATLDPITLLAQIAHAADWVLALREETERLEKQTSDLRREVTNLKAQKRRLVADVGVAPLSVPAAKEGA